MAAPMLSSALAQDAPKVPPAQRNGTSAPATEDKKFMDRARASYYDYKREGLAQFRCDVKADFARFYSGLEGDRPALDAVMPILEHVKYQVLIGPTGASTVSYSSEIAPPTEEAAARVRKAAGGLEQSLTGFLRTWSPFLFDSPPLPAAGDTFRMETAAENRVLTYKEKPNTDVRLTFRPDLSMENMIANSPDTDADFRLTFQNTPRGYLLNEYKAVVHQGVNTLNMAAKVEYSTISGLQIPSRVAVYVPYKSQQLEMRFDFGGCDVKKK
jgi:hypothetical protein